jgi:pyridoxine 5-phosphate synthase
MVFLGVNIDHVATLRNARGEDEPDPIQAALVAENHGADGITAHLREDRRHIRDTDIHRLKAEMKTRLNLEMAATAEMLEIALTVKPYMVTLVPERREELTTEGGLDVVNLQAHLTPVVQRLTSAGILVSLFINPSLEQVAASKEVNAPVVELHTGHYANAFLTGGVPSATPALDSLIRAALHCKTLGIEVNAGHGLTYANVTPILQIPHLVELNIGHNIIAQSVFTGLGSAVAEMKRLLS